MKFIYQSPPPQSGVVSAQTHALSTPRTPGRNHNDVYKIDVPTFFPITQSVFGSECYTIKEHSKISSTDLDASLVTIRLQKFESSKKETELIEPPVHSRRQNLNVILGDIPKLPFVKEDANKKLNTFVSTSEPKVTIENQDTIEKVCFSSTRRVKPRSLLRHLLCP